MMDAPKINLEPVKNRGKIAVLKYEKSTIDWMAIPHLDYYQVWFMVAVRNGSVSWRRESEQLVWNSVPSLYGESNPLHYSWYHNRRQRDI